MCPYGACHRQGCGSLMYFLKIVFRQQQSTEGKGWGLGFDLLGP